MTGDMFIGDHVQLNIGFGGARTRLVNLANGRVLLGASEHAYGETISGLADQRPGRRNGFAGRCVPAGRGAPGRYH
jgi:hypothetical protein